MSRRKATYTHTRRRRTGQGAVEIALFCALAIPVAWSAIVVKESHGTAPVLAALDTPDVTQRTAPVVERAAPPAPVETVEQAAQPEADDDPQAAEPPAAEFGPEVRWFNGRPVRPARTMLMTVTGYSPDARSCGEFADGQTATLHSVWTNDMKLVAADPTVLPYGSMITVPGYDDQQIVPVLDCGGAIKGSRLDLLFPTHRQARKWGVKKLEVVVWEYADGLPPIDPRKAR